MIKKYIFWDNDGVLVDTEPLYYEANRLVLESLGIKLSEEEASIMMKFGHGLMDILGSYGFDRSVMLTAHQKRIDLYQELLKNRDHKISGIENTVAALAKKFKMAIVTSSPRLDFDLIHHDNVLPGYMDFVLAREDYKLSKPNPEPYLLALQKFNARPEEVIVIEDSQRGLTSASKAGIDCIIIENNFVRGHDFSAALKVVKNHSELLKIL
jgi:HAD superfamily hydrolase (TIGR01509 family)